LKWNNNFGVIVKMMMCFFFSILIQKSETGSVQKGHIYMSMLSHYMDPCLLRK